MSVLTRIKNNQITDSTILANTKIVPGSIVGSLFNANLTMTSDVTITGNLTVQGSSTYLTVASTNTYVNDPLIVMNNAFAGTNTNDIGLLFNRGSDTNQAFIWDESEDEFRLIATSETGTTYGAVTTTSYANVRVGNLNVQGAAAFGSLSTTGDISAVNLTLSGDAAVNGGDLTTTATTFNLLTATATTVNAFSAATILVMGAVTGNTRIRHNLDVDGDINIDGGDITVSTTTFNLANASATTVNFAGAATTLIMGATTGVANIRNATTNIIGNATVGANLSITGNTTVTGDLAVNGGDITTSATTATVFNTNATTVDAFEAATTLNIGPNSGTLTFGNPTVVGTQATQNLYNTTATTVNFAGAATTLTIAGTTGNTAIRNNLDVGLTVQARDINRTVIGNVLPAAATFTTLTSQNTTSLGLTSATAINNTPIGNATPSTASFTTLVASGVTQVTNTTTATGVGTGALRVSGGASVSGNLWVGGNINIVGNTFTISGNSGQFFGDINGFGALYAGVTGFTSLPQTVFQVAADVNNYAQVNFENVNTGVDASTDYVATSGNGLDTSHYINMGITSPNWDGTQTNSLSTSLSGNDGYLYVQGDAASGGNLVLGASTPGRTVSVIVGGNTASNVTAVYRAPGTVSTNTTTGALTVTGGVGISGNLSAGNLTVAGITTFTGNIGISSTAQSTTTTNGALVVSGGVGIAKNLNVGGDVVITGNLTVDGTTTTLNTATLDVEDLNITVAKGAASAAAANGAGLTVDGASATLLYANADDSWNVNKLFKGTAASFSTTLAVTGNSTLTGDLAVNGGDITTTATTFNLLDATATTVNAFGAATTITIGATTGTLTLDNPTVVGSQTTQNLYNTIATTLNFAGAVTTANVGAGTGTFTLNNPTLVGSQPTQNVYNTVATTVNAFGAATSLVAGATTGTFSLRNANLHLPNATTVHSSQATLSLVNENVTTLNFAGASTTLIVGATTGVANIRNATTNIIGNATVGANLSVTGNTTITGDLAVNGGDITTTATTATIFNTTATTVDAFKAATDLEFGATTGTLTINNPTVVGTQVTQNLYNTTATTLNLGGAATSIVAGAATGTFSLRNANLHLPNATTIHSSQATVALLNENVTTVNGFGAATALTLGATSGTATVRNAILSLPNATNIHVSQSSITVANVNATTVNAFGSATVLNLASPNGNTTVRGNVISGGILVAAAGIATTSPTTDPADNTTSFWVDGGSVLRGNVFITEEANISYANIYANTISTSSTTGALRVVGGVGLGANLNVGGGAVININQTAQPFQVKGQFATTLIYADSVTDTVTIGGSNTSPISGAPLRVEGTSAMIIPVGTTSQRPGSQGNVDVKGMIRINSSLGIFEYYDGVAWQSSQGSFTVINSETFSGNGSANVFTMLGSGTTAGTIVSINGIVQIPTTSYSITGNVLAFTEAPETGDTIDVRRLTTTSTVDELSFAQNIFKANASYAFIGTGSVSSTPRLLIDTNGLVTVTGDMEVYGNLTVKGNTNGQINIGDSNTDNVAITAEVNSNIVPSTNDAYDLGSPTQRWRNVYSYATVHDQTATNVSTSATPTLVDTFVTSSYSSAKYLVQIKAGSTVQAAELLLVQDTANAYITTYGVLSSNAELGTFTANVAGGNVNLYYTSTSATNSNVKVHTTYIV